MPLHSRRAGRARMPQREARWRIVTRPLNEFGDVVYDVYRGSRRLAWGLKDQEAADRWVARLAARDPDDDVDGEPDLSDAAAEVLGEDDGLLEEVTPFTPSRVWWNDL